MFSSFVIWYLALAGAGSGALAVAAAAELIRGSKERPSLGDLACAQAGFLAAPPAIALAGIALALDLGRPDRIWSVALHPFHSIASFGTASLLVALGLAVGTVACLFFWRNPPRVLVRILLGADIAFSLATMAYSGLLLSTLQSVPFWDTPLVPLLFVASSLSAGLALAVCAGFFLGSDGCGADATALWTASTVLTLVELAVLAAFLLRAALSGDASAYSLEQLLRGSSAPLFWVGIGGAGIVVPVACHALARAFPRQVLLLASMAGVLVGAVCLRYGIVDVGAHVIRATGTVL